jgi:hypothetical protein
MLLCGGSGVNIITEKLRVQLGLSKPKLAPYNLHMANQTITKPLNLIKDLKTLVHGIPYVVMSQPHFEASVRMRLTLPKVGIGSPPGLSQLQSLTTEGKTPFLEVFFIPLERP